LHARRSPGAAPRTELFFIAAKREDGVSGSIEFSVVALHSPSARATPPPHTSPIWIHDGYLVGLYEGLFFPN
jgi:hypothetical protein